MSPLLHIFSSKSAYKSYCQIEPYNIYDENQCALVFSYAYPHDMFDNFDHPVKPWDQVWSLRRWLNDHGLNQFSAELFYHSLN